jgi:hypothetical protein
MAGPHLTREVSAGCRMHQSDPREGQDVILRPLAAKAILQPRTISGASEEVLARWQRRSDDASRALMPTRQATVRTQDPQDAAAKLMRTTLNNISPKPKLGVESRAP